MARILVIDDEPDIRTMLRLSLSEEGHQVVEAAHGEIGLQAVGKQPVDLVLCDLYMPEKEGLETIRELRRLYPTLKIIAMSGGNPKTTHDFLPCARSMGANQALQKPLDLRQLKEMIATLLPPES